MISQAKILNVIGRPQNKATMVVRMHNTSDIINQMQAAHYDNSQFAKKIAHNFEGATRRQTCKNIFNWLKKNVEYRIEPATLQTTKTLQRLVSDGFGDCKHYSGFFAAILSALNIPHYYRFASYSGSKTPTHVYVIALDENGREIKCDAVLNTFDTEKPYTYKIDKKMLMQLSGIGAKGKIKAAVKKVVAAPKQAVKAVQKAQPVKKASAAVKKAAAKVSPVATKIPLAPARAAFLALVALNVRGFASKLKNSNQANLKKKWNTMGGDFAQLTKAINNGATKKALLAGIDENYLGEPTTIAASLAAAVPVIVAVQEFLKDNPAVVKAAKNAFEKKTGQKLEQTPFRIEPEAGVVPDDPSKTTDGGADKTKYLLIGGLALGALYLGTRKGR